MDISVTTWILFLLPVNFAFATFLPVIDQIQEKPLDSKYFDLMRNMAILKLRLQAKGYGPEYLLHGSGGKSSEENHAPGIITIDNDTGFQFSEMEILNMIPVIIAERKEGKISEEDESILKEMFGDLWPIIEEEAIRPEGQEMNPVLKALLQSQEVRQHKRESPKDNPQNDISGNTVSQINNRKSLSLPRRFLQAKLANLSPQQRLLRVAAVLIRSWYEENQPRKMRSVSNHMKTRLRRRQNRRKINNLRKNLRSKRHNILEDASEELYLDLLSNYLQTASSEYNDSDSTASSEESYDE